MNGPRWAEPICIVLFTLLLGALGYTLANVERTQERLQKMELSVETCRDVAAYMAPDEISEGMKP